MCLAILFSKEKKVQKTLNIQKAPDFGSLHLFQIPLMINFTAKKQFRDTGHYN